MIQTMLQARLLTVNQLLRGDRGHKGMKKGKSKTAKLKGAPFKRGICLKGGLLEPSRSPLVPLVCY